MQIIKQFSGLLNSDDSNEVIGATHHKMAKNMRFRGNGANMRGESVFGTNFITNPYLPSGTNECIGAFYDNLKQRIFWFNYNSSGNHGVYQYDVALGTTSRIALVGYNTDGDIFGFTLDRAIYNVKMLYGDDVQGDTLYFNNSQKEPCQINIKRALSGGYGTIKRSYINVIKAPAIMPPYLTYENDATITVNNLRKKLFKFKIRFVYSNKEKSVWSSQGELPLPTNYADTAIDKDPTKNCKIAIVVPTGEADVDKIEIAFAISNGNTYSDYLLAHVIDKAASSIASNDITIYRFLNDQAYVPIDVLESIQTQDLVPLQANALEFLNGNVPVYGGILEGYDPITITGTTTSTNTPEYTTQPPFVFVSNQSGDSGFGTGNIHTILAGVVAVGDTFNIYTTTKTITFVSAGTTTAAVITGLAAEAVVQGFTVVSSDTENLVIIQTNESLQRSIAVPALLAVTDSFVYDWNSRYNYVLTYFDGEGRTIGGQTTSNFSFQTANYTETAGVPNIPKIQMSITNRPPLEAKYFQICRSKNLSKLKTFYWVSDRTYKDTEFAYISIENLNVYIKNNPSSGFLAYDFSSNDRIRFLKVLSGTVNTVYTDQDFDIQSQVFNPNINGEIKEGQFLKIALPTTSGTFDFGTSDFYNYKINLYSPAQSNAEGLDLYYEFGERYTIGDAGLSTRYHQGMLQNQTSNLSQAATFEFTKGDDYLRKRTINTGAEYLYHVIADEEGVGRSTLGLTYDSSTYADSNITPGSSPLQSLVGFDPATNMDRYLLKIGSTTATYTFRIKGSISVNFITYPQVFAFYLMNQGSVILCYLVPTQLIPQGQNVFTFDTTFQMSQNDRVFAINYAVDDNYNSKQFSVTDIKITRELPFTESIIDQNFSDFFQSAVNSNATAGRSYIVDANAQQIFNPTLVRWGLAYQPNTNINQTNRFRELNFDEIDRAKGSIQRFKVRDRILRVFQERACANMGIYAKFLQDSGNTNILTTTDDIITKNNVQYYEGAWGIGTNPTSLVSGKNADYFCDPIRGYQMRLAGNGLTPISSIYKGAYYIGNLITPYNNNLVLRTDGSISKILGYFDTYENQYVTVLQGGSLGGQTLEPQTFSFNEDRNAYCSFYDFHPDWIVCAEDTTYSWKNGQFYIHNNEEKWAYFYNTQYYPSITLVFNDKIVLKKTFLTIAYQANQKWESPEMGDIVTSQPNPQTNLPQVSRLKNFNFEIQEGLFYSNFMKDMNSRQNSLDAWYNGDELKGVWIEVRLQYTGAGFSYVYMPYVTYNLSGRNL